MGIWPGFPGLHPHILQGEVVGEGGVLYEVLGPIFLWVVEVTMTPLFKLSQGEERVIFLYYMIFKSLHLHIYVFCWLYLLHT